MKRARVTAVATIIATLVVASLTPVSAAAAGGATSVIYSSLVSSPLHGNMPSVGAEAYAFNEFGNQVTFAGTNRQLTNVVLTMSSWGCVSGHWNTNDCVTPTGATFNEAITFNLYNPPTGGSSVPGSRIGSVTQTFAIPYRPSASPNCTGTNAGKWFDSSLKTCFNGFATNIQFNFSGLTLPATGGVVYGIAYNTTDYGFAPMGQTACNTSSGGCGYDSLNIALSNDGTNSTTNNVSVGSDPNLGTVWQYSPFGGQYCDGGTAGTNLFRLDSPTSACWSPYVPAIQFKAGGGKS